MVEFSDEELSQVETTDDPAEEVKKELEASAGRGQAGADARKAQKEYRIDLVRRLIVKGVTNGLEIQKALAKMDPPVELTMRTIYRYKGILIKRNLTMVRSNEKVHQTAEQAAMSFLESSEEIIKEAWKQYHSLVATPSAKVSALRIIKDTIKDKTELMQSLGLVYKSPLKHQVVDKEGNPTDPAVNVNAINLNQEFVAYLMAKFQTPILKKPEPAGQPEAKA